MQLTVMFCSRPNSTANDLVSPKTPALDALYAALPAVANKASVEAMFTIRAALDFIKCGSAARILGHQRLEREGRLANHRFLGAQCL